MDEEHDFEEGVIDFARFMRITRKRDLSGEDGLDATERAYLEHCAAIMARLADQWGKSIKGREASMQLGRQLYEALPPDLQDRWGKLKPAEFALLATVFPEQVPPEARRLLGE